MRLIAVLCAVITFACNAPGAALADDGPGYTPGAWHYKSVSCVDTTVKSVGPRLQEAGKKPTAADYASGVEVSYATTLGLAPVFQKDYAGIVHYGDTAGNKQMQSEKAGDKVQVCFLGGPSPTVGCNPDSDDRGRQYRVWDYARKFQYNGYNAEHLCGGA